MREHTRVMLVFVFLTTLCLAGCSPSPEEQTADDAVTVTRPISVCVVNYPLKYFAERIGGDHVTVDFPVPSDGDPAFWKPAAEDISRVQQADLILLNGADYAKWVAMVSLPQAKTINTSTDIKEQFIPLVEATTHSHGPGGEHAHGGLAFTTWLDPKLAILQARTILNALTERWPEHQEHFETGFSGLEKDLLDVDAAIEKVLSDRKGTPLVFSHPVYQYFERRYGLNGRSVHWEPDEMPTDEQWNELAELLKSHDAKWMIWEGEPRQETVTRLREMGIESVVFDPCGNRPEEGDYLTRMQENLSALSQTLGASAPVATGN